MEGESTWDPEGWTWSINDETGIPGGDSRNVVGGVNHTITENPIMYPAPQYTTTWQCHPYESESLLGFGEGRSFNTDQLDFGADHGDWVYCYFTNREVPTYGIHGQKFNDINGNSVWNDEPALNGWTIFIDANDNGSLDGDETSMVTQTHDSQDGWYWFEGLEAGTYKICEVPQAGWTQTYPQNDNNNCHTISVGGELIDRIPVNTCSNFDTLNSILAPSCNFGNRLVPVTTITLDKTGPATATPGQSFTYSLAWTVSGNTSATNAIISDPLPANTTFVSATNGGTFAAGIVTWNLGTQAPGASGTVSVTVAVSSALTTATTLVNTGTFDTDQTNPVTDTVNTNVTIPQVLGVTTDPAISLIKSVNPTVTNPGKTITYTLTVKSVGTEDAKNVIVTDTLPTGFTYLDGTSSKSWTFATIAIGQQQVITVDVQVGADVKAGNYENTAVALADEVSPVTAKASVEVRVPQVLGLATTGVGLRDYLAFAFGLALMAAGFVGFRRLAPIQRKQA